MAKHASAKVARLAPPPAPVKTVGLVSRVHTGDFSEINFATLQLTLDDLLRLRGMMVLADAIQGQTVHFHRFECYDDCQFEAGSDLCDPPDAEEPGALMTDKERALEELVDACDNGDWHRLPDGFAWPENGRQRTECVMCAASPTDILWTFYQKHCDENYETASLGSTMIEALITELTSAAT